MALTKKDLSQIKDIVHDEVRTSAESTRKEIKTTVEKAVEDLAIIVNKGFSHVEERFEKIDKRFEGVDKRFDRLEGEMTHVSARLDTIEHDVADIREYRPLPRI